MKVINLPDSYLKEQFTNKLQNFLARKMNDCQQHVLVLPRSISVLAKRIIEDPTIEDAAFLEEFEGNLSVN